jgi:hypothetical protein
MARVVTYPVHPAADLFPMMAQVELQALGADIARNGQRFPILLWNGTLVDGRNRMAACREVGITPSVETVDFNSEAECIRFIISNNIHRRHLTAKDRLDIAERLAAMKPGDNQHTEVAPNGATKVLPLADVAKQMDVSERQIQRLRYVKENAPDLAAKVKAGELKVSKAASMAKERSRPTKPTKPTKPPVKPDPDRADDSIQDAKDDLEADGATPLARDILTRLAKCSATELTWLRSEVLHMFGIREG